MRLEPGTYWRHKSGRVFELLHLAKHEDDCKPDRVIVVYREVAETTIPRQRDNVYSRLIDEFVERDEDNPPRFEYLGFSQREALAAAAPKPVAPIVAPKGGNCAVTADSTFADVVPGAPEPVASAPPVDVDRMGKIDDDAIPF